MYTYIFIILAVITFAVGLFVGSSKKYKSSKFILKIDKKLERLSAINAVLFGYGFILLFCIPFLYLFSFIDLVPLALSMGIFGLFLALIFSWGEL